MKVLHLISGGDTGGAKTHVLTLLDGLMNIGVDIELLCIMEGVFTQEARKLGIKVKVIPQKKRYDMTVFKKINVYINESNFDLIHCHGARANYIIMFIRHKIKIPILTTLHSDYKLDFKDTWYKQCIFAPINAMALRKFNYILTVTNSFKKMLIERGFKESKLYVVYNGINLKKQIDVKSKEEFLKDFEINYEKEKKYIGIAARLQVVKGVQFFLESAKIICEKNKDIKFLIAGSGSEQKSFKNFISHNNLSDRIYMLGHISDIDSFYNLIDVNTLTSLSESFPYALLEGARMKKATISTDVGGISEMIKDGQTGFLVKKGNINALAERIQQLVEDDNLRKKIGEAFYDDAEKNFSAEKMAQRHKQIYEKIIKENL